MSKRRLLFSGPYASLYSDGSYVFFAPVDARRWTKVVDVPYTDADISVIGSYRAGERFSIYDDNCEAADKVEDDVWLGGAILTRDKIDRGEL